MDKTRKPASAGTAARSSGQGGRRGAAQGRDRQPQATGANRGSPAAPVMKQFAKTRAESKGKS